MIGSYDGIEFEITMITEFDMQPIRTEDDIDYLYTKFTIGFTAIINPRAMSYAGSPPVATGGLDGPGDLPVDTLVAIRHALLQPRKPLLLDIFGDVLLRSPQEVPGAPGEFYTTDCLNGPTPLDFAVTRFDGGRTFVIRWRVETHLRECPIGTYRDGAMISNRFSQSDDVDLQWLTTRTTTGVAHFRNDVLDRNHQLADDFRRLFAPLCPLDMQRVGMVFTVDPHRNAIRYQIVDRQQTIVLGDTDPRKDHPTLPGRKRSGVVDVNLVYTAATATDGGFATPTTIATVAVTVKGSKLASLFVLCQYALLIATRKLPLGVGGGNFVRHAAFVQDHKAMTVQFVCTMQITPSPNDVIAPIVLLNDENLRRETLDVFGDQQGVTPTPPNDVGSRGTMTAKLITAALTTACQVDFERAGNYAIPASSASATGQDSVPPPVVVVNFGEVLETASPLLSDDGLRQDANYTSYSVRIRYVTQLHRLVAPAAGRAGAPTRIITTARPTTLLVATWDAERVNGKPRIPAPESNDPNLVLLEPKVGTLAVATNATGDAKVWHISGEYSYVMKQSRIPGVDPLPMGVLPWADLAFEEHTIEPEDYHHGIIDPASSSLASL